VLTGSAIPELVDCVDIASLHVYAPTSLLFLCGGPIDIKVDPAPSLRDAFARRQDQTPFERYRFLIAEELNGFFPRGKYRDILNFENHIAQISELIVLFSESYGAAAELGAFAMVDEISRRLLVIIDSKNYALDSFITLGPVRMLNNEYGETAVCVINLEDVNLETIRNVAALNIAAFTEIMRNAIRERIKSYHEHTTFNRERPGHLIKLLVGLLQHYGALTLDELWLHMASFDVERERDVLDNFLLCAEFAGWVKRDKRGLRTYFVATASREALNFRFKSEVGKMDLDRWRLDIRQFWKTAEPERFSAIAAVAGKGAGV
jgi:uncharacterized protein YhfF